MKIEIMDPCVDGGRRWLLTLGFLVGGSVKIWYHILGVCRALRIGGISACTNIARSTWHIGIR